MGDIYRQAERVLVWLGPGDENTAKVFSFFRQISARSEQYGINHRDVEINQRPWERPVTDPNHRRALDNIPIEYDLTGIDDFYSNPWFTRLWVVQEVALAREITLCCGAHEISWQYFLTAASVQVKCVSHSTPSNLRLPYGFAGALTVFDARARYKVAQHINLLNCLVTLQHIQCSNDSDRIYAVLSQAGPLDPKIVPDYNKSVRELYVSSAEALLPLQTQTLGLAGLAPRWPADLSGRSIDPRKDEHGTSRLRAMCMELPSWVPDWRIPSSKVSFMIGSTQFSAASKFAGVCVKQEPVKSSGGSLNNSHVRPWPMLLAKGMLVDFVKDKKDFGSFQDQDLKVIRQRILDVKEWYIEQSQKDDVFQTFAQTIFANGEMATSKNMMRRSLSNAEMLHFWYQFEATPYETSDQTGLYNLEIDEVQPPRASLSSQEGLKVFALTELYCYRVALKELLDNRTFFITKQGLVGLAPGMVKAGDALVVIAGLPVPMILRQASKPEEGKLEEWFLTGDCYYHNIMHGELFQVLNAEAVESSWRLFALV